MKFLIPFLMLLFVFECSFGHALPTKELLKNVDVYSVQENNHDYLTIVNPKSKKPTVKEVIYYHVIERPYEKSQVMVTQKEETVQGFDINETWQPQTNSPGLQFSDLDSDENEDVETSDETIDLDEENAQSSDEDDDSKSDDDDSEDHYSSGETSGNDEGEEEEDNRDDEDSNTNDRISKLPPKTNTFKKEIVKQQSSSKEPEISELTETVEKISSNVTTVSKKESHNSETTTEAVMVITEQTATTAVDDVANKKKAARNMLFNQLRDRYKKSFKPTAVSSRKKRDVEHKDDLDADDGKELPEMPEAPIRPELNFDELPPYIRDMISTEKSETPELVKNNDDTEREIEHRIEEMINEVMTPYEEEGDREVSQENKLKKPRTYGMKLNRGTGYVWNNLWSNPGMSFDVGDSSGHSSVEEHKENVDEQQEYQIEPDEKDSRPDLDDIFVNNENKPTDKIEEYLEVAENDQSKVKKEHTVDNYMFLYKEKQKNSNRPNVKNSEKQVGNNNKSHKTLEENLLTYYKNNTEKSTIDIAGAQVKDGEPLEKETLPQKGKTLENIEFHQPKRIENIIEIIKDQDEDFWTWLQDWTSTYMDLLMKHIKKIVQKEVKKQLQLNKKHEHRENPSKDTETSYEPQKDERETINAQADSITIDGAEIPLTHNTNFYLGDSANDDVRDDVNKQSKSKSQKGKRHKDKDTSVELNNLESKLGHRKTNSHNDTNKITTKEGKIDAKNIFGNSYNNDKVTNIYIFYPNADSKKVIEDLNSDKDIKNTAFMFLKPNVTKVEEKERVTTENKKEEPVKEEIKPMIDKKDESTTQITPTDHTEGLVITESSRKDEEENKTDKNENYHKELSKTSTESTTIQSDVAKDTDLIDTTENDSNAVNLMEKKSEDVDEKNKSSEISKREVVYN